jgi:hypothetical protein
MYSYSTEDERMGLGVRKLTRLLAPQTSETPLFMHLTNTSPEGVKNAVNQIVATGGGFDMIIFSFGSGFNLESKDPKYWAQVLCTPCTIQYAACTIQCTPCIIQYTACIIQCTPCTIQYTPCTIQCTPCTIQYTPCTIFYTDFSLLSLRYYPLSSLLSSLFSTILSLLYYPLHSLLSSLTQVKSSVDYANSHGVEIGGYDLIALSLTGKGFDAINPVG